MTCHKIQTNKQTNTIRRIIEEVRAKYLEETLLLVDFSIAFDFILREEGFDNSNVFS